MTDVTEIPEDELGVELDVAIDTAVDAAHVSQSLDEMEVTLDTLADNGDFAAEHVRMLRKLQNDVAEAADVFEDVQFSQRDHADQIRERIQDVQDA